MGAASNKAQVTPSLCGRGLSCHSAGSGTRQKGQPCLEDKDEAALLAPAHEGGTRVRHRPAHMEPPSARGDLLTMRLLAGLWAAH